MATNYCSLPNELRLEIHHHLDDWRDLLAYRHIDKRNYGLINLEKYRKDNPVRESEQRIVETFMGYYFGDEEQHYPTFLFKLLLETSGIRLRDPTSYATSVPRRSEELYSELKTPRSPDMLSEFRVRNLLRVLRRILNEKTTFVLGRNLDNEHTLTKLGDFLFNFLNCWYGQRELWPTFHDYGRLQLLERIQSQISFWISVLSETRPSRLPRDFSPFKRSELNRTMRITFGFDITTLLTPYYDTPVEDLTDEDLQNLTRELQKIRSVRQDFIAAYDELNGLNKDIWYKAFASCGLEFVAE
ncbi:hypothetical protein BJ508DRAFT_59928 [Ascobolus immersus RN42]|uniref:Uncharacterized protein n=1 Tax=Ascobolus immersus RN42 TaxID=1160509 RepID=A0A3N4IRS2_ASCIM|nr:hypothetical protein BJ508DRAFT_59928 [Ascobolus immersus RN42]